MSLSTVEKEERVKEFLTSIGEDPTRPGLIETPERVIRAQAEFFAGYSQDPAEVFKTFDAEAEDYGPGDFVVLRNIEFYSTCEHHLVPFIGVAHVAYIAGDKVIGTSKMARLIDLYAQRLQLQERIGNQVTAAMMKYLKPQAVLCVLVAKHLCISSRGVKKQHSEMVSASIKGTFMHDVPAREEAYRLIKI
jgi:GTP cyclohydrolase I